MILLTVAIYWLIGFIYCLRTITPEPITWGEVLFSAVTAWVWPLIIPIDAIGADRIMNWLDRPVSKKKNP